MREALARRVAGFNTTIFTEMSALALQYGAVNLGQGFPDFPAPPFIKQAAATAIAADLNQYPPMPGMARLRQALAAQWQREHGRAVDWQSEVTVTSGATEALLDLALALLDPGDTAIVLEPAYDAYIPDIIMAGGVPIVVRLRPPLIDQRPTTNDDNAAMPNVKARSSLVAGRSSWWFDEAELRAAFAQRPRFILLNTPHNPTGKVFTRHELELIAQLCQEYDVLAICDEVYDRMLYDEAAHLPLATLPGMWERTLTLGSTGKTFGVTGWKVGWAIGAARLNHALRQAHQWVTFTTATPLQEATAVAIEQAEVNGYYRQLRAEYSERRGLLRQILDGVGLPTLPVEGAYFISCDISRFGFDDDKSFCRWLTSDIGVVAIPSSVFYSDPASAPKLARFCFAKTHATLVAAGERLIKLRM